MEFSLKNINGVSACRFFFSYVEGGFVPPNIIGSEKLRRQFQYMALDVGWPHIAGGMACTLDIEDRILRGFR